MTDRYTVSFINKITFIYEDILDLKHIVELSMILFIHYPGVQ